jgi:MinD superfamily P-loop ATPase
LISTSYWINNSLCHSCKTCKIHGCEKWKIK